MIRYVDLTDAYAVTRNFKSLTFRGVDAKRARAYIRTLPQKDRQRVLMKRTADHNGVHIRIPVKLNTYLKLDMETRSRVA